MKQPSRLFLPALLLLASGIAVHAAEPLYKNDFEAEAVNKAPDKAMAIAGTFEVKKDGANQVLELPGEPLDTFGMLFGPSAKDDITATARFYGTKKGRKFPTFGLSLNGVGGYRLQVSPAKAALEFIRTDEVKESVPFTWTSDTWTKLRLTVRKTDAGWSIEGKAWADGSPEPEKPQITVEEKTEPKAGRAGLWGSPYAGTPIRFDDLVIEPLK